MDLQIAVNGKHFCEFRHRLPMASARFIHIEGPLQIGSITLEGDLPSFPSAPPLTGIF